MILSYRPDDYTIPYKSTCVLYIGNDEIHNGDLVTITSPIFASIDFISKSINTSDRFKVPIRLNSDEVIAIKKIDNNTMTAYLYCNDSDPFNMHVELV